ncbi:MAG: hypothetical protein Q8Q94_01705 [bacterium]|nr:hypothetical protein [bacterium]MDZ4299501.1 hypothetical protein [Candidatus Sungbacteria bacterium]
MTEDQRVLYDNVGEIRNTDIAVRWSIASIFLTLHSVGFVFVATQFIAGRPILIGFHLGGAVLGLMWALLNARMRQWTSYWNSRLEALEDLADPQDIRVFGGDEFHQLLAYGASTHRILMALSGLTTAGWLSLFGYFLFIT